MFRQLVDGRVHTEEELGHPPAWIGREWEGWRVMVLKEKEEKELEYDCQGWRRKRQKNRRVMVYD